MPFIENIVAILSFIPARLQATFNWHGLFSRQEVALHFSIGGSMTDSLHETFNNQSISSEPSIDLAIAQRVAQLLAEGNEDVYRIVIEPVEREVVRRVVAHCRGNYLRASRILGISRMTLRKKIGVKRNLTSSETSGNEAPLSLVSAGAVM